MNAYVSASQLYWNYSIAKFFMRDQAMKHFGQFYKTINPRDVWGVEDWVLEVFEDSLDDFEEFCYQNDGDELIKAYQEWIKGAE